MTDREKKQREILEKVYWWNRSSGDGDDEKMFDQALAELAKLDAIPASKDKILKKYEELTPQGSEFANDSENVYEYIKERLNSASEAKKEVVRLKRELAKSIPTSKEVEEINDLIKEYTTQDNRVTAYPIYVTAQELVCIGVMEDGYSVNCPYGDGVTITKYRLIDGDCEAPEFNSEREVIKYYKEETDYGEVLSRDIKEYQLGYIWTPVEFFLTIKGAEEYIKANAHNHGKLRTYVHHFEDRNFEMRKLLQNIQTLIQAVKPIPSKEVEKMDIEELAEQLHKWYLLAIAWVKKFKDGEPFSHNPDAQKEYKDLSEEQKYIDRYIAKQIIQSYSQISINQV